LNASLQSRIITPMKFEFSAGGVVYKHGTPRKGGSTRNSTENILILLAQHAQHHGWVFPKGIIGDSLENESKEDTAVREVEEETGVLAKIIKPLKPVEYWYQWEGEKRKKTVYYYIMEYISEDEKKKDKEMEQVEWLPLEEIEKRLTYPSDKKVWAQARQLVANSK
jgi:8-oxo-dGTP diphosphatase